jgi:branched-chain amino acid transport system substrate-binding protein
LDQIPGWATDAGKEYATRFEEENGFPPSPSAGGLSYDGSRFFIALANETYDTYGELSSEAIYQFIQDYLWTGEWSFTDGIVMSEYAYPSETAPDPVVGQGYYIFPVLQYMDGEGLVIYPPEWAESELTPKQ